MRNSLKKSGESGVRSLELRNVFKSKFRFENFIRLRSRPRPWPGRKAGNATPDVAPLKGKDAPAKLKAKPGKKGPRAFPWGSINSKPRTQNSKLNSRGQSLIEALIVVGVIAFVMGLVLVLANTGLTAWQKQSARVNLESYAQHVMTVLSYNLHQAQPGTVSMPKYPGELNESQISFKLIGSSNPVSMYLKSVLTSSGAVADRQVIFTEPKGNTTTPAYTPVVLAANVISLYFTYPKISDTSRVLVNIALQSTPLKNKSPVIYQSQEVIYIRN